MLQVVATGAYYPPVATTGAHYPPVATTGAYYAQNGELESQNL